MGLKGKSGVDFSGYAVRDNYFLTVLNRNRFDEILKNSRLVTYGFGLALGLVLFLLARNETLAYVFTLLTLWVFEPALLAFSGFALSDLPFVFFFFVSLLQFRKLKESGNPFQSILLGLLSGMTVTTKFTGFLLIPIFLILEGIDWLKDRSFVSLGKTAQRWVWGLSAAFLWVVLIYLPGTCVMPEHPSPLNLLGRGLRAITHSFADMFYFRGLLSHQTHWVYYPTAFILKSPLTFLIFLSLGLGLVIFRKIQWPAWQWVPPAIFFSAFLFNHDMGLRLILPIYPFCILMAGNAGEWMAVRSGWRMLPIVWAGLLLFQALSVGLSFPDQVGYFNEMVAPERRLYWLGDSNLDFGQDTQRMAQAVKARGWNHVKLAYFGPSNPELYGMKWNYWTQKDLQGPQSGWVYLINDEMIQLGPAFLSVAPDIIKSWIAQVKPTGQIADTWYYFEVPGKIQPDSSSKILSAPVFVDNPKAFQEK
jgi:hypothetical protein